MAGWLYTKKDRVPGDVNICTIYGKQIHSSDADRQFGGAVTRHHIIDIQMLQKFWNAVVSMGDNATMEALAKWAGEADRLPKTRPLDMKNTDPPEGLLKRICWNPFNIIIGPLTNHRIGDPGDDFDGIIFQSFSPSNNGSSLDAHGVQKEILMRQQFNTHISRLARIYARMTDYVELQASVGNFTNSYEDQMEKSRFENTAKSLRSLLVSAVPSAYGIFDGRGDQKLAILHPDLWADYSQTADRWFIKKGDDKKYGSILRDAEKVVKQNAETERINKTILEARQNAPNTKRAKRALEPLKPTIVPYVSVSYFPDIPIEPVLQYRSTTRRSSTLPTSSPMHTVAMDYAFLDRATCATALEKYLKPVLQFAKTKSMEIYVHGPANNRMVSDMASNVAEVVGEWVHQRGYKFTTVIYTGATDSLGLMVFML